MACYSTELSWLIQRLGRSVGFYTASFVCVILGSLLAIVDPLIMRWIVDSIIPGHNLYRLMVAAGCFLAACLAQVCLYWTANLLSVRAAQRTMFHVRVELLEHLQHLSADYHEHTAVGDTLYRLEQDVESVGMVTGELFPNLSRFAILVCFALVAMSKLNWTLTCAILPMVPLVVVIHRRYSRGLLSSASKLQQSNSSRSSYLEELLSVMVPVRLLSAEQQWKRKFSRLAHRAAQANMKHQWTAAKCSVATSAVVVVALATILGFGGRQVLQSRLTIGGLVAFYGYVAILFAPLASVSELNGRISAVRASVKRLMEVEEQTPNVAESTPSCGIRVRYRGGLTIRDLSFDYCDTAALANINLQVSAGERLAIVGPSGSGKSTLAKLIASLYPFQSGSILLDGTDIRAIQMRALRNSISLVLQDAIIFSGTLRENLLAGRPTASPAELGRVAHISRLMPVIEKLNDGWNQALKHPGIGLSGGERQRIALARALLMQHSVLILDEATSALDASLEAAILQALRDSYENTTIIVISHREAVARWVDRVVLLDGGRIVGEGSHADLMKQNRRYSQLWIPAPTSQIRMSPCASTSQRLS